MSSLSSDKLRKQFRERHADCYDEDTGASAFAERVSQESHESGSINYSPCVAALPASK